jgi:hypothetical protein
MRPRALAWGRIFSMGPNIPYSKVSNLPSRNFLFGRCILLRRNRSMNKADSRIALPQGYHYVWAGSSEQ